MSRQGVKIVNKSVGSISADNFGSVRKLDIDYKELDAFMATLPKKDEHVWTIDSVLPPFLVGLSEQLRPLFQLKSEVSSFGYRIWPPAEKVDYHKQILIERVASELSMRIGSRIYITLNSPENLDIHAQGGGKTGDGNVRLFTDYGFLVPLGISSGLDVTINNGTFAKADAKKGFRATGFKKDPLKRIFIVVDCAINTNTLVEAITKEAKKAAYGDTTKEDEIALKIKNELGISEVDKVVESVNAVPVNVVPDSRVTEEDSDIDKIINMTKAS